MHPLVLAGAEPKSAGATGLPWLKAGAPSAHAGYEQSRKATVAGESRNMEAQPPAETSLSVC
jgi:hypothetical protein